MLHRSWLSALMLLACMSSFSSAFTARPISRSASHLYGVTTMEPPTKERTAQRTERQTRDVNQDDDDYAALEYLEDFMESRELDDPFHILLLGSTFDKPKITVDYVSGSLVYVLDMPSTEAEELSQFAASEGMSCLGTWPREECLSLGKQLQRRDIVCRVVPYVEGGQRGWQAKDASNKFSTTS